jgi:cobyrinic acid a,c-diamide synthase
LRKILIAGVTSGSGKTSVVLGLLAALSRQYQIQPYKVGPDYVDTKFHSRIVGRDSRNLDNFLVPDAQTLNYLFRRDTESVDIGLVEGVMGLYDGLGVDKDSHSTAKVAKMLGLPVILVVDGHAASTSIAAIIKGFQVFDKDVNIVGVIINHLKSNHHFQLIKAAIEQYDHVVVLGYLPHCDAVRLPSRQLGLVPDNELAQVDQKIAKLGELIKDHVDLKQLLGLMKEAVEPINVPHGYRRTHLKLGVAYDDAFSFYYEDNLNLLRQMGVKLTFFSPLNDQQLPDVDALYLGGGYPEEFAAELAANHKMKMAIKAASERGMPIYAECGGLMYLGNQLIDHGHAYQMVGVFDGTSEMTPRLKRFGYCIASPKKDTILAKQGIKIRGHEFHHSTFTPGDGLDPVLQMTKVIDGRTTQRWDGGYQVNQTFASYLHIHFYQDPTIFNQLLANLGAMENANR